LRRQLHPWQRSDGSIGGVMMFIEVITARKEAEMALQHSQKMDAVGRLAGGIAHEFNNMLNAIGGFARMARRTPERADRVETCLDEIIGSTDRASELTGQLLSYSRRDVTGKVNNVAPGPLLRDSAKFLRPVLGENIDVSVNCPEDLPELRADGNQLRQALTNLMINARDAMEGKGSITITASLVLPSIALRRRLALRSEERFVLLAVTDNGPGIPESLRTRIFEPFFTTKEQGKGTGLGLAQVYSTCEQAGGAIDIQSQVGDGTTFLLYFPEGKELKIDDRAIATEPSQGLAAQTPGDGEQETSPDDYDPLSELAILEDLEGLEELEELEAEANAAPSPLTILMAEDDPAVRRLVRLTLEEEGHVVYAAEDGQQAVDLALDDGLIEEIDLLVSDVRMPKMGGLDLLAALRVRRPDLKVIFLSGYVEEEDLDVLVSDPLGLLLDKPVLRETLLDALSSISKE
ncbi:MAG: hybrid sensor histidine kinase/response regulator, partial [Rhodospirillaceae bacterium]